MYISQIAEVDPDWFFLMQEIEGGFEGVDEEEIEEACLDKLHRWRALQKLRDLRDELGEEQWHKLYETFASVRNCGYTDGQIMTARDAPLFIRLERK